LISALQTNCTIVGRGSPGESEQKERTPLGRGGSDTTAVAIAASRGMPCEIYTDVDGVYAADPKVYERAKRVYSISYDEMMEMSALGAGVLETRSIEIAKNHSIPLYLGKTLSEEEEKGLCKKPKYSKRKPGM